MVSIFGPDFLPGDELRSAPGASCEVDGIRDGSHGSRSLAAICCCHALRNQSPRKQNHCYQRNLGHFPQLMTPRPMN